MATQVKLTIESGTPKQQREIKSLYNHYMDRSNNVTIESMQRCMETLELLFDGLKVGRGGHHVWVSNGAQRMAIIEFIH